MPWYDNQWKYRLRLNITNSYNNTNVADFITLISFNDISENYLSHFFANVKQDFSDVVFTLSDEVTKIQHEFDINSNGVFVWLRLPTLYSSQSTTIYMYYGNPNATYQSNPSLVFNGFRGIYHLNEQSGYTINDYSGNSNNGDFIGDLNSVNSAIGDGLNFAGSSYISVPHNPILNITNDLWVEFWVNLNTTTGTFDVIQKGNSFRIYISSGKIYFVTGANTLSSAATLAAATNYKITCIKTPSTKFIYVNGNLDIQATYTTALSTNSSPLLISSGVYPINGILDEVRYGLFSSSSQAQYVSASYNNVVNISSFITYSNLETKNILSTGNLYFKATNANHVLLNNYFYSPIRIPIQIKGSFLISFQKKFIWLYRAIIEVNTSSITSGSPLTDFPLLVDTNLPTDVRDHIRDWAAGDDFVFTEADEETVLPHEVENYDSTTGRLRAWVKIKSLPINDKFNIYLYYGNDRVASTQKRNDVWTNYLAVYHLNTNPTGTPPQAIDSTGNGFSMNSTGFVSSDLVSGIVHNGYYFDDLNNKLTSQTPYNFGTWNTISSEAWINKTVLTNDEMVFGQKDTDQAASAGAHYLGTRLNSFRLQIRTNTNSYRYDVGGLTTGWNYLAFNWAASTTTARMFRNGTLIATRTVNGANLVSSNIPMTIGNTYSSNNRAALGTIDEVRISRNNFPDNYYLAVYNNIVNQTSFVSIGQPEAHWRNTQGGVYLIHYTDPSLEIDIIFGYPFLYGSPIGPSGGFTIQHETDVFNDVTIEFVRYWSGGFVLTGQCESSYTENIYQPTGGITISGEAYTFNERWYYPSGTFYIYNQYDIYRHLEFEREAIPSHLSISSFIDIDYINLIFEVEQDKSLVIGGSDYFITFERVGSGELTIRGKVEEFDLVDIVFEVSVEKIVLSHETDDNLANILATLITNKIIIPRKKNDYNINYIYIANGKLSLKGDNTGLVKANALYIYTPEITSIKTFVRRSGSFYTVIFDYVSYGLLSFRSFRNSYSYYPIFKYLATGQTVTLIGGIKHITIISKVTSGKVYVKNDSDILADSFVYNYRYSSKGKISLKGEDKIYTLSINLIVYTEKILLKVKHYYSLFQKNYIYETTGYISIKEASIHRYVAFGGLQLNGEVEQPIIIKNYRYDYISGYIYLKNGYLYNIVDVTYNTITEKIKTKLSSTVKQIFRYIAEGKILLIDANYKYVYRQKQNIKISINGSSSLDLSYLVFNVESIALTLKPKAHYYLLEDKVHKASGCVYVFGSHIYSYTMKIIYSPIEKIKIKLLGSSYQSLAKNYNYIAKKEKISLKGLAYKHLTVISKVEPISVVFGGAADLSYIHIASGKIILKDAIALYDKEYYFKAPTPIGKIIFRRFKTEYSLQKNLLSNGLFRIKGSFKELVNYKYPNYDPQVEKLQTTIKSISTYSNNYYYTAIKDKIYLSSTALYQFEVVRSYLASGKVNIIGSSIYYFVPIYEKTSKVFARISGKSICVGYKEYSYESKGDVLLFGISDVNKRYTIIVLSNGALYELYLEPRGVRKPLAAKLFKFDLR